MSFRHPLLHIRHTDNDIGLSGLSLLLQRLYRLFGIPTEERQCRFRPNQNIRIPVRCRQVHVFSHVCVPLVRIPFTA